MKALGLGLLATVFTISAISQTQPTATTLSPHFRWSERLAHELSYRNTIGNTKDLSPEQRAALLKALLPLLQHDQDDKLDDTPPDELRKLALDTRIELVDLNGDGTKEVVAQANGLGPCGATGNCSLWVFSMSGNDFKLLLDSTEGKWGGGVEKIRILPTATNGYRDIVLGAHDSAVERTLVVYSYHGDHYRISRCYGLNWMSEDLKALDSPQIWPCHGFRPDFK